MADGVPPSDLSKDPTPQEDLPDRLRVHSLARSLGTTSRRVLDALRELDGRIRSAHSSVDRVDAMAVRDLLSAAPADSAEPGEPESRLILETTTVERAEYLPLFVAPQPIRQAPDRSDSDDSDEADEADEAEDSEDFDDSDGDDDQAE
ncbi:MAG: ribonuclease E/G, partial [Mycobacterium sp.]